MAGLKPAPRQYSADGRWWWDGTRWLPNSKADRFWRRRSVLLAIALLLVPALGIVGLYIFIQIRYAEPPDLNDTWTWDGNDWRQVRSDSAPPMRQDAVYVYSDASHVVLLFGGYGVGDTWTFDGRQWMKQPSANEPSPRGEAVAAYDPIGRQVIMFGGKPCALSCDHLAETWSWADGKWLQLQPASSPVSLYPSDLLFDPIKSRLTLFGTHYGSAAKPMDVPESWVWENSTWTLVQSSEALKSSCCKTSFLYTDWSAGAIKSLAFQKPSFGGGAPSPIVQSWDGSKWIGNQSAVWAPPTIGGSNTFFPPKGYLLAFGGYTCELGNFAREHAETWTWDRAAWTMLHPKTNPPPRFYTYLTYAAAQSRVVMFGASANHGLSGLSGLGPPC